MYNPISYEGKNVVVTGAASGMGAEVVKMVSALGAKVYALDLKEVADVEKFIKIDLGNKDAIDAALAEIPDGIDALFHVAGIPGVTLYQGKGFSKMDVARINYIGARYFVEGMIPKMNEGSGIITVASIAAMMWRKFLPEYKELLAIDNWDDQLAYFEARQEDPIFLGGDPKTNQPYVCAKTALVQWSLSQAWDLSAKKIRINALLPGPTKTPMHKSFVTVVGKDENASMPTSPQGEESTAEEQAAAMVFLNSGMASYISGEALAVDYALSCKLLYFK